MSFCTGIKVESEKEYKKWLKSEPSDIERMTQYDKLKRGLDNHDGSDTDEDGLTDKEEIEEYGSDPLKPSTSGDFYLDSYKVEHGMDINTYYEYQGDINFDYNECDEVNLNATQISDFNTVVKNITGTEKVRGFQVYQEYYIYNYSDKVTIDLKDILEDNNISIDDVDVLINNEISLKKSRFSIDGDKIQLKKKLSKYMEYKIYIVSKNSWSSFMFYRKSLDLINGSDSFSDESNEINFMYDF